MKGDGAVLSRFSDTLGADKDFLGVVDRTVNGFSPLFVRVSLVSRMESANEGEAMLY